MTIIGYASGQHHRSGSGNSNQSTDLLADGLWDPTYTRVYGGRPGETRPLRRKGQGVALSRLQTLITCAANHLPSAGAEKAAL
jgi:hypothetical protein